MVHLQRLLGSTDLSLPRENVGPEWLDLLLLFKRSQNKKRTNKNSDPVTSLDFHRLCVNSESPCPQTGPGPHATCLEPLVLAATEEPMFDGLALRSDGKE